MPSQSVQQAIELIKSGQRAQARQILMDTLQADPKQEAAWLWLATVMDKDDQRIRVLEKCLSIFPDSQSAQKGLGWLGDDLGAQQRFNALKSACTEK